MLTIVAFVLGMGALIAFHEFGHYRVARWCGVKVLRFSIGFGKPLLRWQKDSNSTEFVLCALPLGGYVHMLDERETKVAPHEKHLAFNNKSLGKRAAIVAAGPIANIVLAVLLYACVQWWGVNEHKAIVAQPPVSSLAAQAGLHAGDHVRQIRSKAQDGRVGEADDKGLDVRSFQDLRWALTQAISQGNDVEIAVSANDNTPTRWLDLPISRLASKEPGVQAFMALGITSVFMPPKIGDVMADGAAALAGIEPKDLVIDIDGMTVADAQGLRQHIQSRVSNSGQAMAAQLWRIKRGQGEVDLMVQPRPYLLDAQQAKQIGLDASAKHYIGRIGAFVGAQPDSFFVKAGFFEGISQGVTKTWDVAVLSLRMLGQMVTGQASLSKLRGPITIAEVAGKSASVGLGAYLSFLGLISVSLAVLNLLPIPILDGGHLMYYLWEWVTGKPVPPHWISGLTRGGMAMLFTLMTVALFNDIARIAS